MQCTRCREELPENTPICPACGPIVIGAGFGSSLPVAGASGFSVAEVAPVGMAAPVERKDRGRRPARPPLDVPSEVSRAVPGPVVILATADLIAGLALLAAAASVFRAATAGDVDVFAGLRYGVAGGGMIAAAAGLFLLKPFGRTLQLMVAGFSVFVMGSTMAGLLTFAYLGRPALSRLFQGLPEGPSEAPWAGAAGGLWTGVTAVAALFQVISALVTMAAALSLRSP